MTYVVIRSNDGDHAELAEMRGKIRAPRAGVSVTVVSPEYARSWVRSGGHHSTPLWVDTDGKVRYASG